MRKIWGKLIPIALMVVLLVLVPTSTIAIDSEHRDLLQSIIDNTEAIDTDTGNLDVALSTRASETTLSSIDTDTSTIAGDTTSIDTKVATETTLQKTVPCDWSIYVVTGNLTSDGVQYSTSVDTTTADTDVTLLSGTFEPMEMSADPKDIVWVYFNVACEFLAVTSATADIQWKVQARNEGGTWTTISDTITLTDPGNGNWANATSSKLEGYAATSANFDEVPFDWQILFQCNELNEGRGRVTNSTMMRAIWDPSS